MIKRQYLCYYEGQQEKMYFNHFSRIIKEKHNNVDIKFESVKNITTLERSSSSLPKLAIFDYDFNEKEFEKKVKICNKTKILYSNVNFDLWLLLHKKSFRKVVSKTDVYVNEIRKAYGLDSTADIKTEHNMKKILSQIGIDEINFAMKNAKEIIDSKLEKDKIVLTKKFAYYPNPSTNLNDFFNEIFDLIGGQK